MEKKLKTLFDFQRFAKHSELEGVIVSAHTRRSGRMLSEEEEDMVSAAGGGYVSEEQKRKEEQDNQ